MAWGKALAAAVVAAGALAGPAQAATPVANGGFARVAPNARIVTALPDGSHRLQVSGGPGKDLDPAFSPDAACSSPGTRATRPASRLHDRRHRPERHADRHVRQRRHLRPRRERHHGRPRRRRHRLRRPRDA
jgi:hypothetical protein